MLDIAIQGFGYIALLLIITLFQIDDRQKMLLIQIVASCFFIAHFGLLGAYTGAAMNLVIALRNMVFVNRTEKKWADKKIWLFLTILVIIIFTILTWDTYLSILPAFGIAIGSIAFWMKDTQKIRIINLFPHPGWFYYGYVIKSVPSMLTSVLIFSSIAIAIIRFDILKISKE